MTIKGILGLTVGWTITLISGVALAQQGGMQHQNHQMDMQSQMQAMMPNPSDAASTRDFKNLHMQMMMSSPKTFTGDADVDFARQMIAHHQGGIDMAKVQLQYGKNEKMRKAAEKIIADQQKEIAALQEWLSSRPK